MDINATLFGQFIALSAPFFGLMCYWIVKGKVKKPLKYGVIGGVLWLMPLLGLIYLMVIVFKSPEEDANESLQSQ